jgi:integrase
VVTFSHVAEHYIKHDVRDTANPKAAPTVERYLDVVNNRLIPRWGDREVMGIKPLEIRQWLLSLKEGERLEWTTLDKYRRVMYRVFEHGQLYDLLPLHTVNPLTKVSIKTSSNYEAISITPKQTFTILNLMRQPEKTLTLLIAATGLRISEALGLRWEDVDWTNRKIHIRRTWVNGTIGAPKTKASRGVVPLHSVLADFLREWRHQTPYASESNWVFASTKLQGKQPLTANMLVEDHLRPAAVKVKVLPEGYTGRFGFHNLRHALATWLVANQHDPKTVQKLLRHADVKTTLGIYSHGVAEAEMKAQGDMLEALLPVP